MEAFGFYTLKVKGSDIQAIDNAINECKEVTDQAVCLVISDSVKGQGVPYFETLDANHSVKFNTEQVEKSLQISANPNIRRKKSRGCDKGMFHLTKSTAIEKNYELVVENHQ